MLLPCSSGHSGLMNLVAQDTDFYNNMYFSWFSITLVLCFFLSACLPACNTWRAFDRCRSYHAVLSKESTNAVITRRGICVVSTELNQVESVFDLPTLEQLYQTSAKHYWWISTQRSLSSDGIPQELRTCRAFHCSHACVCGICISFRKKHA